MKTYITEIGAVIWVIGQIVTEASKLSPEQSWIPWLVFIGGILTQTGYQTMSLRAVSKIVPNNTKLQQILGSEPKNPPA